MQLNNSKSHYGLISITLHWLVSILTIALFASGLWMVELDYYHSWYQRAPWLHKGFGVGVFLLLVMRVTWKHISPRPAALANHRRWETRLASITHVLLNLLIVLIALSGYFIVTASGDALGVFGLVQIPALISDLANLEDMAGEVHEILAFVLIALVALHALAAIKHHAVDKDRTLLRMFGR